MQLRRNTLQPGNEDHHQLSGMCPYLHSRNGEYGNLPVSDPVLRQSVQADAAGDAVQHPDARIIDEGPDQPHGYRRQNRREKEQRAQHGMPPGILDKQQRQHQGQHRLGRHYGGHKLHIVPESLPEDDAVQNRMVILPPDQLKGG
ncbi:hypothetical protein D3C73_1080700 [compost metagenome]